MAGILGFCGDEWPWQSVLEIVLERFPEKGIMLEVGSGLGQSASKWAENLPHFKIHTVDIAQGIDIFGEVFNGEEQLKNITHVIEKYDNLSFTKGDFANVEIPTLFQSPDVFFYDGHHGYQETRNALFRFKDTKLIIVDDYCDVSFPWCCLEVKEFLHTTGRTGVEINKVMVIDG